MSLSARSSLSAERDFSYPCTLTVFPRSTLVRHTAIRKIDMN